MDIAQIINQVESPFTDEEIGKLIKIYIECNCNMDEFYKRIQLNVEEQENPYLDDYRSPKRCVEVNPVWEIIRSSRNALSIPFYKIERVPMYRIYINAQGQDKAKIVEEYIRSCEEKGRSYSFKYSRKDGRKDSIIIASYGEDFARNIELIERITEGMNLGEPTELVGVYKDKIGIGEEYIEEPSFSYTQTRLGLIPIAMQKFFLDHKPQFEQYLAEEHKELGDSLLDFFRRQSINLLEEIEEFDEDELLEVSDGDLEWLEDMKYLNEDSKRNQLAYQNNIKLDMWQMYESLCKDIPETMQAYIAEHYETAIPEIIENYRLACEIFGISRDGVFSIKTEQMLQQAKQTPLQQRDSTLAALEKEARGYDEVEALKSKLEQREGQNIGE